MSHRNRRKIDLFLRITKRQIQERHQGSLLGLAWSVIQPTLIMAIYTIVFGFILKTRYGDAPNETTLDFALGLFLSLTVYQPLAEVLINAPSVFVNQANLVKKVVFPLAMLPLAQTTAALYQTCISLLLVLTCISLFGPGLSLSLLYLPILLFPLLLLTTGVALLLSTLGVFLRDIQHGINPFNLMLMYASALFYSSHSIPSSIWAVLKFNPLIHIIENIRNVVLWQTPVHWSGVLYCYFISLIILSLGIFLFRKLKTAFADVL